LIYNVESNGQVQQIEADNLDELNDRYLQIEDDLPAYYEVWPENKTKDDGYMMLTALQLLKRNLIPNKDYLELMSSLGFTPDELGDYNLKLLRNNRKTKF
jgi:hypothetical protein